MTKIGNYAFQSSGLTSVVLPDTVTSLGTSVFQDCAALTSATVGEGIAAISNYTFRDCTALAEVTGRPEGDRQLRLPELHGAHGH